MLLASSRLEYRYAFDTAASWLGGFGPRFLAIASTAEFAQEVLLRSASGDMVLVCEDGQTLAHAQACMHGGLLTDDQARCQLLPASTVAPRASRVSSALWATPCRNTWQKRLGNLAAVMQPGGQLCVLATAWPSSPGHSLRTPRREGEPRVPVKAMAADLEAAGFVPTRVLNLGGWPTDRWAGLGRVARALGRPDLQDRAEQAHHRDIAVRGWHSYQLMHAVHVQ